MRLTTASGPSVEPRASTLGEGRAAALDEREVLALTDAVQRRIAHDLHDGLGQLLAGAALMAKGLSQRAPTTLRDDLERLVAMLNDATGRVQSIARGLAPLRLRGVSAAEALRDTCAAVLAGSGAEAVFELDPLAEQGESVNVQMCLIAQEAVRNALRHGRATRIAIRFAREGERIVLSIQDNGAGLGSERPQPGLGLESMAARARSLGGSLAITRLEPAGTLVRGTWPAVTP
jgi:signal transduction histidine kinase